MPARGSRRKRKKAKLPQWQVTIAIVVAVMVLSAVIWYLVRGQNGFDTPFDARLLELAGQRGVAPDAISADDPIRKVGDTFVRTWLFDFPNRAARDGFLGDLEIEGAARGAQVAYPEELGAETVLLRIAFDVEVFDLQLSLKKSPPPALPETKPTPVPSPTPKPKPKQARKPFVLQRLRRQEIFLLAGLLSLACFSVIVVGLLILRFQSAGAGPQPVAKFVVRPGAAGKAHDTRVGRQPPFAIQAEQCWYQFALSQIA